jgi:glutamyl-tRNA synthetase
LYTAFGAENAPKWIHVPLVVDASGRRLAKRTDALSLASLRDRGVLPSDVIAWAAESAGIGCRGVRNLHEVTPVFDVGCILKDPVRAFEK